MAEETTTAPAAGAMDDKTADLEARLKGEKPEAKTEPDKPAEPDKKPEPDVDPEIEKIVAQADRPDAVRNAIKRQQDRAEEARERAEAAEAKVKEFEDRDKSEQEKLEERAASAERDAASAKSRLVRFEVATAAKLPMELADRLQGDTKRELEQDAQRLLELVKPSSPSGDPDAGKGAAPVKDEDFSALLRQRAGLSQ